MDACLFSTEMIQPRDQRNAWSEWFQPVFDVVPDDVEKPGFVGQYKIWKMGNVSLARTAAPAARSVRQSSHLRRDPVDHWVISLCRNAPTTMVTKEGQLNARPAAPYVWSLGQVSESRRPSAERLQLYLPRDSFADVRTILDNKSGTIIEGPRGSLLADYMSMLERSLAEIEPEEAARLPAAIQEMVRVCLAPSPDTMDAAAHQIERTLMERVRLAVRRNLYSPSLGPDKLCREAAMSRSQLYRVLESKGGAASYILRSRLAESFGLLCNASKSVTIGRIAELLCFADASTFSRSFRREFGMSPSEARSAALVGMAPTVDVARRLRMRGDRYADHICG